MSLKDYAWCLKVLTNAKRHILLGGVHLTYLTVQVRQVDDLNQHQKTLIITW